VLAIRDSTGPIDKIKFCISPTALYNYLDYQELKFAQKNAAEAKKLAIIAIIVSSVIVILYSMLEKISGETFMSGFISYLLLFAVCFWILKGKWKNE
jgi:tellurite resistance protein TehA-like permease